MKKTNSVKQTLIVAGLTTVLWACGGGSTGDNTQNTATNPTTGDATAATTPDEAAMVDEIASSLQACSYDGSPLTLSPDVMKMNTNADAATVVGEIMRFTGLPQNFEVMEENVPNAAAVIVIGRDKLPHRVIAFNKAFMNQVRTATQNNDWAPISVLAHEIGHHLCGHTIMPGGSQPPTELEADKFSGFVLSKMGALLADAQKAIQTLIPEQDGPTHPGRAKRLAAIEAGWKQACAQQSFDCSGLVAANKQAEKPATATEPAPSDPGATTEPTASTKPATPSGAVTSPSPAAASVAKPDVLPDITGNNIPTKFDRFVIDEIGILKEAFKQKLSKRLFDHAKSKHVEIVAIIAKDLQGKTADEYAYDILRQFRIGQLEVGNGACLVIAPNQNDLGVALGSGIRFEFDDSRVKSIKSSLKFFMDDYNQYGTRYDRSEILEGACDYIMRDTKHWEWVVRYQNLNDMLKVHEEEFQKKRELTGASDPMSSMVWRKIVRVKGTLISKNGGKDNKHAQSMTPMPALGFHQVMEFQTEDGKNIALRVNKYTEPTMTARLEEGKTYSFVLREHLAHSLIFDLLSYDLVSK